MTHKLETQNDVNSGSNLNLLNLRDESQVVISSRIIAKNSNILDRKSEWNPLLKNISGTKFVHNRYQIGN